MSDDFDTREKVEQTETGYRLTVTSTRGSGTRDQDKVKAELRSEDIPSVEERDELCGHVTRAMNLRRAHNPDDDDDD